MRLAKGFYVLFLLSLSLDLFCGELPELFSLSDDTANDFVEDSAPATGEIQKVHKDPEPALRIAFTEEPVPELRVIHPAEPTLPSGPDLLRLFSIQRK